MWFRRRADTAAAHTESIARVLDPAFGLFVWALHLLAIYVAAALACVLGMSNARSSTQTGFLSALVVLTLLAEAASILHGAWRYRRAGDRPETQFRLVLTLGLDAIAALAIMGQLLPLALAPLCR